MSMNKSYNNPHAVSWDTINPFDSQAGTQPGRNNHVIIYIGLVCVVLYFPNFEEYNFNVLSMIYFL